MANFYKLFTLLILIVVVATPMCMTIAELDSDGWRRTAHGWEHISNWRPPPPALTERGPVHPGLIAAMQLLIAAALLVHSIKEPSRGCLKKTARVQDSALESTTNRPVLD